MARAKKFTQPSSPRRYLNIFAADPMLGKTSGNRMTIDIVNEPLKPGPTGQLLKVVDYDGGQQRYYEPVDLDDPDILQNRGLEPSESDPRFHQQMVYAVGMKVIENFERALGRRFQFPSRKPLVLVPHAFYGANAYYDRNLGMVLFGYFRADTRNPGLNLPGQTVFTCLSHDIIAHEMTHAILDRMRRFFLEASNIDVLAFHEGFADIVALFQHFSFHQLLTDVIQNTRSDLRRPTLLVDLARQFGHASGTGKALRSALDKPEKRLYESVWECHERGSILVASVFDAFFTVYQRRIEDLIRIATGGTGVLPRGNLHPDLVRRIASEASKTAQSMLTMCIRAIDYLPPVDITFGDYLRALITADSDFTPVDEHDQRGAIIEAFRKRGIYPDNVISLAEESILLEQAPASMEPIPIHPGKLEEFILPRKLETPVEGKRGEKTSSNTRKTPSEMHREGVPVNWAQATALHQYAIAHAEELLLDPEQSIRVQGFRPLFRTGPDGQLRAEFVAQFVQTIHADSLGGIPFRGGTTLIADFDGTVKYINAKPIGGKRTAAKSARARFDKQLQYTQQCKLRDPLFSWNDNLKSYDENHMALRSNLAHVHGGLYR